MDSEERSHAYGGTDRAGSTGERPSGARGADSLTIGELARDSGVTLRALRFYQSKGLLAPRRNGSARLFSLEDRDRLMLILQGKRLGFTLTEIREMLSARDRWLRQGASDRSTKMCGADHLARTPAARHRRRASRIATNLHRDVYCVRLVACERRSVSRKT